MDTLIQQTSCYEHQRCLITWFCQQPEVLADYHTIQVSFILCVASESTEIVFTFVPGTTGTLFWQGLYRFFVKCHCNDGLNKGT